MVTGRKMASHSISIIFIANQAVSPLKLPPFVMFGTLQRTGGCSIMICRSRVKTREKGKGHSAFPVVDGLEILSF